MGRISFLPWPEAYCAILLLICWPSSGLNAQPAEPFSIEVSGGMAAGWWLYNHGSSDQSLRNNLGWDETRLALFVPATASFLYRIGKFRTGIGASHTWFFIDEIRKTGDAPPKFLRDSLSRSAVKFLDIGIIAEYDLISKPGFVFGPHLAGGIFSIKTIYPGRNRFGNKFCWEIGLNAQFRIAPHLMFNLRPQYKTFIITPVESTVYHERHTISNFGANAGLRYVW
ncbi:MAG: hypothetical protein WD077_12530 [Bacteroidia bacterium]